MRIAVTSQNRKHITEHAGRCRNFWIFHVEGDAIRSQSLLELPKESSFHDSPRDAKHPLDDMDVLIAGGMGQGLRARLADRGITAVVTTEKDPKSAVLQWLAGSLPRGAARAHAQGHDLAPESERDACSCNGR